MSKNALMVAWQDGDEGGYEVWFEAWLSMVDGCEVNTVIPVIARDLR